MTSVIAPRGSFTIDDLDSFPQDSNRYELIEGSLHVTPAPAPIHQRVLRRLVGIVEDACPRSFEVFFAPLDVQLGPDTVVEPDLLVIPAGPLPDRRLVGPPLLVVEILSPTTRAHDLGTKAYLYRQAGVGAYWVVDPTVPSITAWRWDGAAEHEQRAEGDATISFDWPFPVTVTPSALLVASD